MPNMALIALRKIFQSDSFTEGNFLSCKDGKLSEQTLNEKLLPQGI
jgi:hypothetical protein